MCHHLILILIYDSSDRSMWYSVFKLFLFVCRSVKASHVLISADGQVCMSGLRSIFSLIRHGQRAKVVHDFPQYSVKVLPWLSPEVLQQVFHYFNHSFIICGYCLCPRCSFYKCCSEIDIIEKLMVIFLLFFFPRTCRATTLGQTSTALGLQPVNWQTDMCPLKTCQLHRWSETHHLFTCSSASHHQPLTCNLEK